MTRKFGGTVFLGTFPHADKRNFRPPLARTPNIDSRRWLFIGGLHRSGTTVFYRLLRAHPDTSGFKNTGLPADEGQYLQTVYPRDGDLGGVGALAFHEDAHMTEESPRATPENRDLLLRQWGSYLDLTKPILVEKSPANLVRTRFLQALYPEARFVVLVRHPAAVALAEIKWRPRLTVTDLFLHWCQAHRYVREDLPHLKHALLFRYEDFCADPAGAIYQVQRMCGLSSRLPYEQIDDRNAGYFKMWEEQLDDVRNITKRLSKADRDIIAHYGYSLVPPYVSDIP